MTQEEINNHIQNIAFDANDKFRNKETVAKDIAALVSAASKDSAVGFGEWIKTESIYFEFAPNDSAGYYRRLLPLHEGQVNSEYVCRTTAQLYEKYEQSKIK